MSSHYLRLEVLRAQNFDASGKKRLFPPMVSKLSRQVFSRQSSLFMRLPARSTMQLLPMQIKADTRAS